MLVFRPMRRKFRCPLRNEEWSRLFSTFPRLSVLSLPKCIKSVPDLSMLEPLAVANFRCPIAKKSYFSPLKHGCYIMYIMGHHQRPAKLYMRFAGTYVNCVYTVESHSNYKAVTYTTYCDFYKCGPRTSPQSLL
jgi:hypothetical protein